MSLKKCKECGNEVSTNAASCPKCGAVIKKKIGCLGCLGVVILIIIIFSAIHSLMDGNSGSSSSHSQPHPQTETSKTAVTTLPSEKQPEAPKVYKEGDSVNVGYTSYAVWHSWWSNRLGNNPYLNQPPNAAYLFVDLTVRNNAKTAHMIPPFELIDENGAKYEASSNGWAVQGSIGVIESLNPSVSKRGFVIFDIPRDRKYRLKLSGGYWSAKDAYVQLTPSTNK